MRTTLLLVSLLCTLALTAQNYRQRIDPNVRIGDTTQLHMVTLADRSQLLGVVHRITADTLEIELRGAADASYLPTRELRYLGLFVPPRFVPDPRNPRTPPALNDLTLLRTALPYPSRRQFKTVMLAYNSFDFALDDHWQLGFGLAGPLGLLFTQRYRTSVTKWLHLGLSNEFIYAPVVSYSEDPVPLLGDATTLVTVGSQRQFFTLGAGLFYLTDEVLSPTIANYRAGLGTQVGRGSHLYLEALVYAESFRFTLLPTANFSLARRRHRWSFGVATAVMDGNSFGPAPLPYVSYTHY